jgi:hypothetical protein
MGGGGCLLTNAMSLFWEEGNFNIIIHSAFFPLQKNIAFIHHSPLTIHYSPLTIHH